MAEAPKAKTVAFSQTPATTGATEAHLARVRIAPPAWKAATSTSTSTSTGIRASGEKAAPRAPDDGQKTREPCQDCQPVPGRDPVVEDQRRQVRG
jgi:hypothetical protein